MRNPVKPPTDRFSQPLWNEGKDWERDEEIENEKADQAQDKDDE
jgi:hypothetical protein